jgi:hypothetical protein
MGVQKHSPGCNCCACGTIVFTVQGCGARALAGATVTVHDGSTSGDPVLTSGTTDSLGNFTASIASAKTYYYEVTKSPRFTLKSGTIAATCTTNNQTVTMSANIASGYHCHAGVVGSCADPMTDNLTLVDPAFGSITLSFGTSPITGWIGCRTVTVGGVYDTTCANPASRSVGIKYLLSSSGPFSVWVGACASGSNRVPKQTDCTTVDAGHDIASGTLTISCSPFSASCPAADNSSPFTNAYELVYGTGSHTFTISE